jgi:hypothetical protein
MNTASRAQAEFLHQEREGDHVAALGDITSQDGQGSPVPNAYCDVWRFRAAKWSS